MTLIRQAIILIVSCFLLQACYKEQTMPATADFSIEIVDNDYSVPVKVAITNKSSGGDQYKWTFEGTDIPDSDQKDPGVVTYTEAGSYKIVLVVTNKFGGESKKEVTFNIDSPVLVDFRATNSGSEFSPVTIAIDNLTDGATSYEWQFEGGMPAGSTDKEPGPVTFTEPGQHKIVLKVSNGKEVHTKETTINVKPALVTDFDMTWLAEDGDMQVPFVLKLKSKSQNATQYQWICNDATIANTTGEETEALFNRAGTFTITLSASNDKGAKEVSKIITLLPNTNLYTFTDVRLGINTAQSSIGCYFSSKLGRVVKSGEVNAQNGNKVDFIYFGMDESFTYNKFLSPQDGSQFTFSPIPNAISTSIINKQEDYSSTQNFTVSQFDALTTGDPLQQLSISSSAAGYAVFQKSSQPRIILFKTEDNRIGAVKIKDWITNGGQSYIVCDIKVQKQ